MSLAVCWEPFQISRHWSRMNSSGTGKCKDQPANRYAEFEPIRHGQEQNPAEDVRERAFKVPVGESPKGTLVCARHANPSTKYICPGCGTPLVFRNGEVNAPHFAHQGHAFCSPETALHLGVKNWMAKILCKCLKGQRKGIPKFKVPCMGNNQFKEFNASYQCDGDAWLSFADLAFDEVAVEQSTTDGLKPDVLLLNKAVPILGIEVLVTHSVDGFKAARYTHPWIEVEATQVLQTPRFWKPIQTSHPWTNLCQACLWANKIVSFGLLDENDPGDYAAQLSASIFESFLLEWLPSSSKRIKPAVYWRCPWCRKINNRIITRDRILGVAVSSSLLPPCEPEVTIENIDGTTFSVIFGFPKNPDRPWLIAPLPERLHPIVRATPAPKLPHRILLNGTNRPLAFICRNCCRDCLGMLPSSLSPVKAWELLYQDPGIK